MSEPLLECVPNFSEGRDDAVIEQIAVAIRSVQSVRLLGVDPGRATNRTVYTFVGPPKAVVEAAVRAARVGSDLIDMSRHHGEHPRFGALDVCPLVPISGLCMHEAVEWAKVLGKRLADEVGLTIFLYERAAIADERKNLANVRSGEYEGLESKLADPDWEPDFGPRTLNVRSGATAVGARDFLVAYNVNLNTISTRRANAIAFDIREKGRKKPGSEEWIPGTLKATKAIAWFIEEFGFAQISINLTDIGVTPIHVAFDEVCRAAEARGVRVTGSELVGLVPLRAMLDAGRYFLRKQHRSTGVSDAELVRIAILSLGLDQLGPFNPQERIIEYAVGMNEQKLAGLPLGAFIDETASESPAPGGGSIAAAMGAFGASLATMVANLSAQKRGWDDRWEEFSQWAEQGKALKDELVRLIDADTDAFDRLMESFGMPKATDEEAAARTRAVQEATQGAIEVPLRVMELAGKSMDVLRSMAETGNPNSVSDAGVGALAARAAVRAAYLNVRTNLPGLADQEVAKTMLSRAADIDAQAEKDESDILKIVEGKL